MAVLQDIFIYKSRQWARDSLTSGSTELLLEKCAQSGTNSLASLIIRRGHMTELMPMGHKWKLRGLSGAEVEVSKHTLLHLPHLHI